MKENNLSIRKGKIISTATKVRTSKNFRKLFIEIQVLLVDESDPISFHFPIILSSTTFVDGNLSWKDNDIYSGFSILTGVLSLYNCISLDDLTDKKIEILRSNNSSSISALSNPETKRWILLNRTFSKTYNLKEIKKIISKGSY